MSEFWSSEPNAWNSIAQPEAYREGLTTSSAESLDLSDSTSHEPSGDGTVDSLFSGAVSDLEAGTEPTAFESNPDVWEAIRCEKTLEQAGKLLAQAGGEMSAAQTDLSRAEEALKRLTRQLQLAGGEASSAIMNEVASLGRLVQNARKHTTRGARLTHQSRGATEGVRSAIAYDTKQWYEDYQNSYAEGSAGDQDDRQGNQPDQA